MVSNALKIGVLFLSMSAALNTGGCSDSTSPPPPATVSGTVTDADGPVEGASILVSFRPSVADLVPPRNQPGFQPATIGAGSLLGMWIDDVCGERIRTLCADSCSLSVFWDGLDDDGKKVLDGFYLVTLKVQDDSTGARTLTDDIFLFTEYPVWDPELYRSANARTAPDGSFEFDDRCLGFGKVVTATGESGVVEYPLTRWIDLLAVHPDGRRAWEDSLYVPEGEPVTVDLVFEDAP